ncbi:gliding motility lipoprotein GldB [Lutibacter flavus]|uniref:Protein involved in gliding motility GldB n=1 Tax=Lutibacter flavus TaxID=691689 RepID=A0A238ZDY4_9FLAO|nr:gliding motility lipoprotein GldB [Lutibacter flavus]SNR81302.1 protein involved in gliding motility GldB [Lutibacter flavus]
MDKFLIIVIVLFSMVSCKKDTVLDVDVSNIKVDVSINRFEQKFFKATDSSLLNLKNEYPYLFPVQNPNSVWLNRINNKDEIALNKAAQLVFKTMDSEKKEIESLFKHIKYYQSNFNPPKIITLITNLDYENKVVYADSLLFVSLDMYLGKDNEFYKEFPSYISQNFDKSQLVVDIAKEIGSNYFYPNKKRQFIDLLINEGKKMYLLDCFLPRFSDANKMGYLTEEIEWAKMNETEIWKYFIEKKLLYSSDPKLSSRFIENAPFSKFFIDIDKESPGRIGVWLGWQIVRSYMKNNNVTLQQLLKTDGEEIFKKSKYKPKK